MGKDDAVIDDAEPCLGILVCPDAEVTVVVGIFAVV